MSDSNWEDLNFADLNVAELSSAQNPTVSAETGSSISCSSDGDVELFDDFKKTSAALKDKPKERVDDDEDELNVDEAGDGLCVMSIEGPLPNQPTHKALTFGESVEKKRAEIFKWRQTCKTTEEYQQLYKQIDDLISQAENKEPAISIRLLIDKAVAAHFGLDFKQALAIADKAIRKARQLPSKDEAFQLELTSTFVQCSVYSRQGDFGKAWGELQTIAANIKGSDNSVDHWRLHYNMGTNLLGRLKASNVRQDRVVLAGVSHFEKCRESISDGESRGQAYDIENHFYSLVMATKLLLDLPEHKAKRENDKLSHENIMKAQDLLETITTDYPAFKMVLRFKLRLFITYAGLYFRRGQRNTRDGEHSSAHGDFINALLILESAAVMCENSPYEEGTMIEEFLNYLSGKAEFHYFSKQRGMGQNMYHIDVIGSLSENELDDPESEGFTSDDFGNPTGKPTSKKTRKRRTKTVRQALTTLDHYSGRSVTASTSISTVSTQPSVNTANRYHTLSFDVLLKIELEHHSTDSTTSSSSVSTGSSLSTSFSSSGSAALFRIKRDMDEGYPVYEPEFGPQYTSPSATESSSETELMFGLSESERPTKGNRNTSMKYIPPDPELNFTYRYLTRCTLDDSVFGVRHPENSLTVSTGYRMGILSEISAVRKYMCSNRPYNRSKDVLCVPLLVSAKLSLDFPENSFHMKRFIISMSDFKSAFLTINTITEGLPVSADAAIKCELLIVQASFYYRAAQFAAKYKLKSTCKLSLNLAMMYIEFAEVLCKANNFNQKMRVAAEFRNNLNLVSGLYFDKYEDYILLNSHLS